MKYFLLILTFLSISCSQQKDIIKKVSPYAGVVHRMIIDESDTLLINVIEIDMSSNQFELLAVKGGDSLTGRETVSSMVKRLSERFEVIAGINTDFFMMGKGGEPINNLVADGEVVKGIRGTDTDNYRLRKTHHQFAVTDDNRFYIERFELDSKLFVKEDIVIVNRINSVTDSGGITLYNKYQGHTVINEGIPLRLITVTGDTLVFLRDSSEISGDKYVLSYDESFKSNLNTDTLKMIISFTPDYGRIKNSAGGWGKIVDKGKNLTSNIDTEEEMPASFSSARHPRSGIGFSADSTKIFLITVDGRQPKSRGVSLQEFAEIMLSEGVYSGMNLDGGGSTTLVFNGKVVNSPSDNSGERPVGSGLVVIRKKEANHE